LCWLSTLLRGFSPGTPVFLPQQKPTRSLFELAVGCAPRSCMGPTAAASGAYICFRSDLVELRPCCTLRGRLARQLLLLLWASLVYVLAFAIARMMKKAQYVNL